MITRACGWFVYIATLEIVAVYLVLFLTTSTEAACLGDATDRCELGLRLVSCAHNSDETCCVPCERIDHKHHLPVPVVVIVPPVSNPESPPETFAPIAPPITINPPLAPPPILDCPTRPQPLPSDALNCYKRGEMELKPTQLLKSCRDLDDLLLQLEEAQTFVQQSNLFSSSQNTQFVSELDPPVAWLSSKGFVNTCPELFSNITIKEIKFSEKRGCRGVLEVKVDITLEFAIAEAKPNLECERRPDSNPLLRPVTVSVKESFFLETRHPAIDELEDRLLISTGENLQCLIDLPGKGADRQLNKTLLVGPDCFGGSVPVVYSLRTERKTLDGALITGDELTIAGESNDLSYRDKMRISYIWETKNPETGEICTNETLRLDFNLEDNTPPHFIEPLTPTEDQVYLLPCYFDLTNFFLEYSDNCDKTIHRALPLTIIVNNVTIPANQFSAMSTCVNSARASLIYAARDVSGNEARRTLNILVRDSYSPTPVDILREPIVRKCRSHIPPPFPIKARDNCYPNSTLVFSLKTRTFSFDRQLLDTIQEDVDGNSLLCENKLNVTDIYQLCDGCSRCVEVIIESLVNDNEGPLWISPNLPPEIQEFQCLSEVPPFNDGNSKLLARDECDQNDIEVEGIEEIGGPVSNNSLLAECSDNLYKNRRWIAKDTCGNEAEYINVNKILDTTPPALVDDFQQRSHFCLAKSEPWINRFLCFSDSIQSTATLIKGDNCGGDIYLEFVSAESFACSDPEDISSCTKSLSRFTKDTTRIPRSTTQYNRYYEHNNTLCLAMVASTLHVIHFEASDVCGNSIDVPWDVFAPKREPEDRHYDPQNPYHPCDNRQILSTPRYNFEEINSILGPVYMTNTIDYTITKKTVPIAPKKSSSATRTMDNKISKLALVYMAIILILLSSLT